MKLVLCLLMSFASTFAFAETLNNVPPARLVAHCQGDQFPRLMVGQTGGDDFYRTSEYSTTIPYGNCVRDARALQIRIGAAVIAGAQLSVRLNGNSPLKDFTYSKTLQLAADKLTAQCRASHAWDENGYPVLQVASSEGLSEGHIALIYETTSYNTTGMWDNCQADADKLTAQFKAAKLVGKKIVFKQGNSPKKDFRISDEESAAPIAPNAGPDAALTAE